MNGWMAGIGGPRFLRYLMIGLFWGVLTAACANEEKFPDLGLGFGGPVGLDVSADGQYFYVLNSDFERMYNEGSILVIKEDGTKVRALSTARMGRGLKVAGQRMLAFYDSDGEDTAPKVEYYDLSTPEEPRLVSTWELDCSPINVELRGDYAHFAIACLRGGLYIGTFADDPAQSTIKKVRDYGINRRAMFLDTKRELLLSFVSDMGQQDSGDGTFEDLKSYNDSGDEIAGSGSNEIPDNFENTKASRRRISQRYAYQYAVYDIKGEREAQPESFPLRKLNDTKDPTADLELRWLYFNLFNADGTPDTPETVRNSGVKNYRTNFWEAKPAPESGDSFYLSQRGTVERSNNVIKVSIIGDLRTQAGDDGAQKAPLTPNVLQFERVYGFKGELDGLHYPGDFVIRKVGGQDLLVVNHFRDLVYWKASDRRYSLAAKVMNQGFWLSELKSTDHNQSYYQIAMNQKGRAISLSYYGGSVFLLDVQPGADISVVNQIF